ncbi:unnamed protein product [Mucor hiemalis]
MINTLITPTASYAAVTPIHFIVGGGAYMTYYEQQPSNDFERIYPSACLFCGIPNGKPIVTTSDPCITDAPTMQRVANQRVVHTAVLRSHHHHHNNVSKSINSYFKAIKKFVIRKQLYLFATMYKRRFAF